MIVLVRCNCAFISNVRYSNLSPEFSQGQSMQGYFRRDSCALPAKCCALK